MVLLPILTRTDILLSLQINNKNSKIKLLLMLKG